MIAGVHSVVWIFAIKAVDQARLVVEVIVGPTGELAAQTVADGVVLEREEGVEESQPDPEIRSHFRPRGCGRLLEVARGQTIFDAKLAVFLERAAAAKRSSEP